MPESHRRRRQEETKKVPPEDRTVFPSGERALRASRQRITQRPSSLKCFRGCSSEREEGVSSNNIYVHIKGFQLLGYCKVSDSEVTVRVDQVRELVFTRQLVCLLEKGASGSTSRPSCPSITPETPVGASLPSLELIRSVRFHAGRRPRRRPPPVA